MFIVCFLSLLDDPGLWGGAPSILGWVGSTVNQHCRLRSEALLWGLGENVWGGAGVIADSGCPLGPWALAFLCSLPLAMSAPGYRNIPSLKGVGRLCPPRLGLRPRAMPLCTSLLHLPWQAWGLGFCLLQLAGGMGAPACLTKGWEI